MKFEVVTLVSSSPEAWMLRENLLDRGIGVPLTILVRPGVQLSTVDPEVARTIPIGPDGVVEKVLKGYATRARSRWLLQVDPDERWPTEAFQQVERLTATLKESEAAAFPMTYFVGSRPLRGGPWGAVYQQRLNSAASYLESAGEVHMPPPATRVVRVSLTTSVQHFWVKDLGELRAKEEIYLRSEGKARLARFGPYRSGKAAAQIARTVAGCVRSAPWKDGILGVRLAAEMVRYQLNATAAWRRELGDRNTGT